METYGSFFRGLMIGIDLLPMLLLHVNLKYDYPSQTSTVNSVEYTLVNLAP